LKSIASWLSSRTKRGCDSLESELRDRFGPPPPAVELLLQLTDLKILAADRGITAIEVKDDKLMLTRHGEYPWGQQIPPAHKKRRLAPASRRFAACWRRFEPVQAASSDSFRSARPSQWFRRPAPSPRAASTFSGEKQGPPPR
jgi:hypothetical protein